MFEWIFWGGAMASDKTAVIEYLFNKNWDEATGTLRKSLMSLTDVSDAIRACNLADGKSRSDRNPANFLKDVVRSRSASSIWPKSVSERKFTGVQRTGKGDSFEFVPYKDEQKQAFPDGFRHSTSTKVFDMQTLSIPLASKALGRSDEAWLVQTAVKLGLVEQLLATVSTLNVSQVTHLQMNIKLRAAEIDSLYLLTMENESLVLATCEAKLQSERLIPDQIIAQVKAAFDATDASMVVPMAMRAVKGIGVHVLQFQAVRREDAAQYENLVLEAEAVYRLKPSVKGI
ncbi:MULTISPECIES: hypothetical protein [unclassified Stenotrophomonas]|uniref:hypothetical protein n=1 Tax=unclassified Stenotrophomonas TaxID=196198 RepID=UPI0034677692